MGKGVLRVYQEDWHPFQNLPAALKRFSDETGIPTELGWDTVGVGTIEHMFEQMIGSFTADDPAYDIICTDEIILRDMAQRGRVLDLAPLMRRDELTLDTVTPATREAVSLGDAVLGLPCINTCSMLLYRRDLFDRYGLPVPADWTELREVAGTLQDAVRRDEGREFYGFETRGAAGGGHAVWSVSSFLGSYGARWLDGNAPAPTTDAHITALATYLDIIRGVCPPDQDVISFVEMRRDMKNGRVGMVMDVGNEYAHILDRDPELADKVGVALVPAGPAGRAPNLYTPPWAIPVGTDMPDEAWELAKFLTSNAQLTEDGLKSNAVETSSLPVLYSAAFDRHFREDLLSTVRASRAIACEERPFSDHGIAVCEVVGNAINAALRNGDDAAATYARIHEGLNRHLEI
ncbi:ABC transporter substrate-binding protein [Bauldia litoralis]|uniref:ABC-type glycerol-3-phosphate transport system, substrate-binding protein n=1 Tax=Bauldia litoralis TaxID=665467 RepID=A0A1G6A5I8_9HYPH|nr:extracellular solute-binding protein [Bauldia litoralis]SDB03679.1 ABC-type glycerol-3-phosphate transport system, substrate-binding protein [Bauldia litoralis]